jgi:signal transduction histidine kinase
MQSVAFSHRDVPGTVDQDVALCVFRVVQEALRNAVKHSGALHLSVDLIGHDDLLQLTIVDDGRGFDVDRASRDGLGLTSMRERLESVGGSLDIDSTPGSGTRLNVRVPVSSRATALVQSA